MRARGRLRALSRLRWVRKAQKLRLHRADVLADPWWHLRFLLWDPEVENFSYELANDDELGPFVAEALGVAPNVAQAHIDELHADAQLGAELERATRWRFRTKRSPPLGRRAAWYAAVRISRPALVVETGVHDGLGSVVLLSALARNGRGRLISLDPMPGSGWLVPERLRPWWEPVWETSFAALERSVTGRQVGMLVHDSLHTYECERFEFQTAIRHAAAQLVLLSDNAHETAALRDTAAEHGVLYSFWAERPRHHFYPGGGVGIATFEQRAPDAATATPISKPTGT